MSPYISLAVLFLTFQLISAVNIVESDTCTCEAFKDYIILFDNFQSATGIWATQQFVATLAHRLRSLSEENRVAVGDFSGIKSTFEHSKLRKDYAFEQAILDLDIMPASSSTIKTGMAEASTHLKLARSGQIVAVLFVVASKAANDKENDEIASGAKKLNERDDFVGFAIGIGSDLHENTLKALSIDGRYWVVKHHNELRSLELNVAVGLCNTKEENKWVQQETKTLILYEHTDYKGLNLVIELHEKQCLNLNTLPKFFSVQFNKEMGWDYALSSINNNGQCIAVYKGEGCTGETKQIIQPTVQVWHDEWNDIMKSIKLC